MLEKPKGSQEKILKNPWTTEKTSITFTLRQIEPGVPLVSDVDVIKAQATDELQLPPELAEKMYFKPIENINVDEPVPAVYGLEINGVLRVWTSELDPVPSHNEMNKALEGVLTPGRIKLQVSHMLVTYNNKPPKIMQTIELAIPRSLETNKEAIVARYQHLLKPIILPHQEEDRFFVFTSEFYTEVEDV